MEPFQRLALARSTKFKSKAEFARHVGEKEPGYSKFERDYRVGTNGSKMTADRARQFGEPLGIRYEWLMWGEGSPWAEDEPIAPETPISQLREVAQVADETEARALMAAWAALKSGMNG